MRIVRGSIFCEDGVFRNGELRIEGKRIVALLLEEKGECLPLTEEEKEIRILPGLCDLHSHGCVGHDTCEASESELYEMLEFERSQGITSYCPTTMTYDEGKLSGIMERIKACGHPNIKGIYLEGPFISYEKKGAQNAAYIQNPDAAMVKRLKELSGGLVRFVAVAPEVIGAMEMIEAVDVRVTLAHTAAKYDTAVEAFSKGARQVTHLYNAMPAYNHREPGVIGAAYDCQDVMCELICDGIHVHDAVIRNTFRQLGPDRVILISDSMEATGMPDGTYALGGQEVWKKGRLATLADGTLAGSASTLFDCLKHTIEAGVPEHEAIWAATRNPAKAMGILDEVGSLVVGKVADVIMVDRSFALIEVVQGE